MRRFNPAQPVTGLTVSGGEPFMQADALNTLLRMAKEQGLHTAVETGGQVPLAIFEASFENIDLFLFDLKHNDADKLKKVTGGDLNLILDNLTRTMQNGRKVIVRIPVIPGFNNDPKTLSAILRLAEDYGVQEVHLLPYHTFGKSKYAQLGIPYEWNTHTALGKDETRAILQDVDVPRNIKIVNGDT